MTPLPAGLLDDILAEPDNDTLRLIAAEFWDENGEPERGEFIRLQVRIAHMEAIETRNPKYNEGRDSTAERLGLRRCERELLLAHAHEWNPWPFPEAGHVEIHASGSIGDDRDVADEPAWLFRRGFVEVVTLTAADWLAHANALTAAAPIREVVLTTMPDWDLLRRKGVGERLVQAVKRDGDLLEGLLAAEWPRIKFTLPPVQELFAQAAPVQKQPLLTPGT